MFLTIAIFHTAFWWAALFRALSYPADPRGGDPSRQNQKENSMRKLVVCCFLLSVPASVLSQSSPRTVSETHVTTPKPGMSTQWEAGRKQHSAFHAAQKDTWSVYV